MRLGTRRRSLLWCGCGLAAFALGAAACGGSSSHTSGASSTTSGASTTGASSGGSATSASSATASGGGTQVTVGETEFKLTLSTGSFRAGNYTFKAVNNGRIAHSLEITGPGINNALTPTLQPGQSADLHVTLQNGSYDLFCPIDSHKSLGMNDEITVGAVGASTATSTATPSTTAPSSGGVSY